jgi:hypothetical protein
MDLLETSRQDKKKTVMTAVAIVVGVFLLSAPVVSAATQRVRVVGPVNVQDSTGDALESAAVPGGAGQGTASAGALAVRNFAGGGGLITNGDCDGDASDGRASSKTVAANANTIITAIILTGPDAHLSILAPGLEGVTGAGPISTFETTAQNPTVTASFATGLRLVPAPLVFSCTGTGDFVLLGQLGS